MSMRKIIFAYVMEILLFVSAFGIYKHINEYKILKSRVQVLQMYYEKSQSRQRTIREISNSIEKFNSNLTNPELLSYSVAVYYISKQLNLDYRIIVSLGGVESRWNPTAKSSYGAIGVMQVAHHVWRKYFGFRKIELYNPIRNIYFGSMIFKYYLDESNGNIRDALRKYSGGTQREVYYEIVLSSCEN